MNTIVTKRELLNIALKKQNEGVNPRDNKELQILQELERKALNKAGTSLEFMINLDKELETRTSRILQAVKELTTKKSSGRLLSVPPRTVMRRKRAVDESESNSSTKRSKPDNESSVKESTSASTSTSTSTSTNASTSTDANTNSSSSTNPPKEDKQSPIDYILEKQTCDMPDIFEADGGGD